PMTEPACDYCGADGVELAATPYLADAYRQARMCRSCWGASRARGVDVEEIDIGEFPAGGAKVRARRAAFVLRGKWESERMNRAVLVARVGRFELTVARIRHGRQFRWWLSVEGTRGAVEWGTEKKLPAAKQAAGDALVEV